MTPIGVLRQPGGLGNVRSREHVVDKVGAARSEQMVRSVLGGLADGQHRLWAVRGAEDVADVDGGRVGFDAVDKEVYCFLSGSPNGKECNA